MQCLRPVRSAAALLVAVTALLALGAPPATAAPPAHPRLLVVAVPGLLWRDVADMPRLRAFVDHAAVGDLSVKSLTGVTRCGDGILTLSAGARVGHSSAYCNVDLPTVAEARQGNLDGPFAAVIGAFGQALHDAGLRTAAIDGPAHLLLADTRGRVDLDALHDADAFAGGDVVAAVLPALYSATGSGRPAVAGRVDQRIGELVGEAGADTVVAVVGLSDLDVGRTHLHVFALRTPVDTGGSLTTVHRAPYLQLIDVAPTLLAAIGVPVPAVMDGEVADRAGLRPTVSALADADVHATTSARLGGGARLVLWIGVLVIALLWVAGTRWAGVVRWLPVLAWPFAFAPILAFLVQVVPWWRGGRPAYVALVAGGSVVLGALGAALAGRLRSPAATVVVPAAFGFTVLVADQLAGAPLQFSAPMGDNPLVAGRFRGMGNTDFALMTTCAVLLSGVAMARLHAAGRRRAAVAVTATIGVVALAVDGLPMLGDDFGGMLSLLPVVAGLLVVASGVRLTPARVVAVGVAIVAVVVAVAVGDYLRPADQQTHIGRFVDDVLHGGGGHVVSRKAAASARSFRNVPAVLAAIGAVVAVVHARQRLFGSRSRAVFAGGAAWMLGLLAVLGSVLNDSGAVVAAFVAVMSVPALVLAAAQVSRAATAADG